MKNDKIAIKLKDISKVFEKNKKEIIVFRNINYNFKYGKLYCIYGHSGIGKTTLMQIIGTMINPTSGNLYIKGKNINEMSCDDKATIRNNEIGFIFQDFKLIMNLTALENVLLPCYSISNTLEKEKREFAISLLTKLGLENRMNHYPSELSGGEQQRVAIVRAIINNPNIILADEPTGSLDDNSSDKIIDYLVKLARDGKCVIVVSHDKNIKKYSDITLNLTSEGIS